MDIFLRESKYNRNKIESKYQGSQSIDYPDDNLNSLIIFFCGWALDYHCFSFLESDMDILFVYNYRDFNLEFDFSKYKKIFLIAYSYGVYVSSKVVCCLPKIDYSIAINGTLRPIDKHFGISEKVFNLTCDNLDLMTINKFYGKLFNNQEDFFYFSNNFKPLLPIQDNKESLINIKNNFLSSDNNSLSSKVVEFKYDKAIISENDRIFPFKSQLNFWNNYNLSDRTEVYKFPHFPFFQFRTFREILEL